MRYLNNLYKLVLSAGPWKNRLTDQHLRHHTPRAPHVNRRRVVLRAVDEFGRPIIPRAYVRYVRLPLRKLLSRPKIT